MRYLFAVLALLSCSAPTSSSQVPKIKNATVKQTDQGAQFCASRSSCAVWAPFVHVESDDPAGPIWFLTAEDGSACEVPGMYAQQFTHSGQSAICEWRRPRFNFSGDPHERTRATEL